MEWEKPNGQRMEAQDNEATNEYLVSLGFKKVGIEIGEPTEAHEITQDEMPEQQSIEPDDVGEMPNSILGG